jgi:hypothetical protein
MANDVVSCVVPTNLLEKVRAALNQEQVQEFAAIFSAVSVEKPKAEHVDKLRAYLQENPELCVLAGSMNSWLQNRIIAGLYRAPALRELTDARLELMRRELTQDQANPLEQMLIEHVVLCWLRFHEVSHYYQNDIEKQQNLAGAERWEKRLSFAQRRYLRAIETITRIRRMGLHSPVQINIANQQIVSGG